MPGIFQTDSTAPQNLRILETRARKHAARHAARHAAFSPLLQGRRQVPCPGTTKLELAMNHWRDP